MPKMKTVSGAKKRFRRTKSGKIKRHQANGSHILTKKAQDRKRKFRKGTMVDDTNKQEVIRLMPYIKK